MKEFNTTGPCNSTEHYMIDAATRLQGVEELIDDKKYFVIHAARQSGKTTYLRDLALRLNAGEKYYALYCSLEGVSGVTEPERGIPTILDCLVLALQELSAPFTYNERYEQDKKNRPFVLLSLFLMDLCKSLDKPLVILFDEVDCLSEGTLISFLRQLRDGYNSRPYRAFPHSVALVGMRNIHGYRTKIHPDEDLHITSDPFSMIAESLTFENFTKEEIIPLYQQHTNETGQIFKDDAIELVWKQTQGQPCLVNAIAREAIMEILKSDFSKPVTTESVSQAVQNIILTPPAHIDYFLERLKEESVLSIIKPMIFGEEFVDWESDEFQYVKDLGLIIETKEGIEPANPVYGEVIAHALNYETV